MNQEDLSKTVMPFGKHKGKTFDEIPLSYLDWVLSLDNLHPRLEARLEAYLAIPPIQRALEKELGK